MTAILSAEALRYAFPGDVTALDGLSLSVAAGESLAILGPNGAGKSTLLLHLNGSLRPQSGQVLLGGAPVGYSRKALTEWRRRVALVLQDADDQLFAATVFEDVSFGPLNLGLSAAEARARVEEALEMLSISDLRDRPTHMLSGGQKRRVAIAGAVAMRPEVLLLDEPTAGLDEAGSAQLIALLQGLMARGMTLVFSTHDVELACALASRVALFRAGQVVGQGVASDILSDRAALTQVGLAPPLLYDLALRARDLGLLDPTAALPRTRAAFEALMQGWAKR
ncbi:cobalt/nickel transport system ATP-binding protein [Rhodobacter sp. JA431]|uniref:energy-coupling factor ABC transporter ATP-binding protein n=1 Tax=Rhodobacter sp. JA431 TaxID=570013 RepID=UPI000BC3BA95|nr:ATP-binding cassette domain-containing protein [Rhodobacter sp. JA431]SOB99120.1 cobalt/nickel transport system ATP-binding protein [Rhodobacter sp. JA431]